MADKDVDWRLDAYLESHHDTLTDEESDTVNKWTEHGGCYWHDVVGCVCDEDADGPSDADEGL